MARFAKGSRALAISDRSGAAFPYREMVQEWTGAWVHISEFEPKQPQLKPHPIGADPQGLLHARPARVEFAVQDILPNNPFNLPSGLTSKIVVKHPNSGIQVNDQVRLTATAAISTIDHTLISTAATIQTLELSTTLASDITDSATTLTTVDSLSTTDTTGGFLVIEKINSDTGLFENEVIQYTSRDGLPGKTFSGLTRGTNAPFRGVTPTNTTASAHPAGAKIFFSRKVLSLNTTTSPTGAQPSTITNFNGYNLFNGNGSTVFGSHDGGGFQCTAGPLNINTV